MNAEFASSSPPFCLEEETPEQNHQDRGAHQKPQENAEELNNGKQIRRHRTTSSGDTSFVLSSTAPGLLRRRGNIPTFGPGTKSGHILELRSKVGGGGVSKFFLLKGKEKLRGFSISF